MEIPDLEIRKEWKSSHFYIRLYTILHIFPINNFSQFLKKCYCLQGGKTGRKNPAADEEDFLVLSWQKSKGIDKT